ncbi:hypothetical protein CFIMG_006378RA [Ceratocystis fimbriata CBS 114723]|uniref:Uncharacterized protein n=1 Tax=Ceratocystis fimbriata CBS 114723 TaxID=1035309 RepID=A0A2C5WVA0_9PEZI|nr:hypothetical protein CFIMG_006378RA [Ceratocystis fimbriata CBS 114723]
MAEQPTFTFHAYYLCAGIGQRMQETREQNTHIAAHSIIRAPWASEASFTRAECIAASNSNQYILTSISLTTHLGISRCLQQTKLVYASLALEGENVKQIFDHHIQCQ